MDNKRNESSNAASSKQLYATATFLVARSDVDHGNTDYDYPIANNDRGMAQELIPMSEDLQQFGIVPEFCVVSVLVEGMITSELKALKPIVVTGEGAFGPTVRKDHNGSFLFKVPRYALVDKLEVYFMGIKGISGLKVVLAVSNKIFGDFGGPLILNEFSLIRSSIALICSFPLSHSGFLLGEKTSRDQRENRIKSSTEDADAEVDQDSVMERERQREHLSDLLQGVAESRVRKSSVNDTLRHQLAQRELEGKQPSSPHAGHTIQESSEDSDSTVTLTAQRTGRKHARCVSENLRVETQDIAQASYVQAHENQKLSNLKAHSKRARFVPNVSVERESRKTSVEFGQNSRDNVYSNDTENSGEHSRSSTQESENTSDKECSSDEVTHFKTIVAESGNAGESLSLMAKNGENAEFEWFQLDENIQKTGEMNMEILLRKLEQHNKRDYFDVITQRDILSVTAFRRDEVANRLGICLTLTKKLFRKKGIRYWPYRSLYGIRCHIRRIENQIQKEPRRIYAKQEFADRCKEKLEGLKDQYNAIVEKLRLDCVNQPQ
eukprot:CAMPEP_0182451886 /NCGR_PEP_ID=MMETSP1172-20130603/43960_1 /TAXON_ID=708627 /ORGANISM="Timspurckia oligopyrenoides, Strain CCMP3278" /LENGTH=550 /DNA_ID=CAMNT_0024649693 /DNA_START=159 /DNA_END=1811 /DNA_ORIENTATION=+